MITFARVSFVIYNSNEQISHLLVGSQGQILSYFQSQKEEKTLVCSHQKNGQSSKTENTKLSKDTIRTSSSQHTQIL